MLFTLLTIGLWFIVSLLLSGAVIPGVTAESVLIIPLSTVRGDMDQLSFRTSILQVSVITSLSAMSITLLLAAQHAAFFRPVIWPMIFLLASTPFEASWSFNLYRFLLERAPEFARFDSLIFGLAVTGGSVLVATWLGYKQSAYILRRTYLRRFLAAFIWISIFLAVIPQSAFGLVLDFYVARPYSWASPELWFSLTVYGTRLSDLSVLGLALLLTYYDAVILRPVLRTRSNLWILLPLHLYVNIVNPLMKIFLWLQRSALLGEPLPPGVGVSVTVRRPSRDVARSALLIFGGTYAAVASFMAWLTFTTDVAHLSFLVPLAIWSFGMGLFFMAAYELTWQNQRIRIVDGKVVLLSQFPNRIRKGKKEVSFKPQKVEMIDKHTILLKRSRFRNLLIRFRDSKTSFEIYKATEATKKTNQN